MQLQTLLCIGSLKTPWAKDGCKQYIDRIDLEVIEVAASKQKDPLKQKEEECQALLSRLDKLEGQVWVLDETGKEYTSPHFSEELSTLKDQGMPVIFVLGGAYGLNDAVRARGDQLFGLSKMTLPHELCRIVILEQIYRADQILKGSRYHH